MDYETVARGLCFGEGPRWRDGALWFSDMHDRRVLRLAADGALEPIVEVPNQPSGLGWTPAGDLVIVSMTDRRLLRHVAGALEEVADLSRLASFHLNDMVVDASGRAYIGNFGFDLHAGQDYAPAELICVAPDGRARVVAQDMGFPNGTVVTPDGATLIVAESFARRLTAFDVEDDGALSGRRLWAEVPDGAVPDGICLDEAMGIWVASPTTNECLRLVEGGRVTHRLSVDQGAYACMLGDESRLYMLTAGSSDPDTCREARDGRVDVAQAPYPHAGLP